MKKSLLFVFFLPFLPGCSFSPTPQQQQKVLGNEEYKANSGKVWTVNKLREDYKNQTGMILVAPDTNSCGWNSTCYQNTWARVYDKGLADFNAKRAAEEKLAESKCLADPECKRSKDLLEAGRGLSWGYSMLLGSNPYSQANTDYQVRDICDKVTTAQKNGVSRDVLANRMRDLPGIAPGERRILTNIVKSCWDISKLSGDWRETLRQ